jgi:hypothetical protein
MISIFVVAVVTAALGALYLAWRFREFRKFLAGAFLVSSGIQLYLYAAQVSVPLLGTGLVQTPDVSAVRGIFHLILFAVCLVTGFLTRPRR